MEYTIDISTNSMEFESYGYKAQTVTVTTNGSSDNNCYYIMTDIDWITITYKLGEVTIVPSSENNSNYDREGYVVFYNVADNNVFKVLDIRQKCVPYKIEVSTNNITLSAFEDSSEEITVTVYGGLKNFYINTINEYFDGNRIVYDKALMTKKLSESSSDESSVYKLNINGHGAVQLGATYEIVLSHINMRDIQAKITVSFENVNLNLPTIKSKEFVYCEKQQEATNNIAIRSLTNRLLKSNNKVDEKIYFEYNGVTNPELIEIGNNEVKIKVYTVINGNNGIETDSDIYIRPPHCKWITYRYANNEYTKEYKVIYVSAIQKNKYIDRYCTLVVYNKERKRQSVKIRFIQKT